MRWLVTTSEIGSTTTHRYVDWLVAGGVKNCLVADARCPEPDGAAACDALLLSGGGDIEPARYGQPTLCDLSNPNPARDGMERDWIRRFREAGKPVFGVCRGLQILWVRFQGILIQHLDGTVPGIGHGEMHEKVGKKDSEHGIVWTPCTRLAEACGAASTVNSAHHQAADPAWPVAELRVAALSPAGVIEAIESVDGPPVSAVQWHPERLHLRDPFDPACAALLRHWISLVSAGGA